LYNLLNSERQFTLLKSKYSRFNVAAYMKERRLATETLAKQNKELIAKKQNRVYTIQALARPRSGMTARNMQLLQCSEDDLVGGIELARALRNLFWTVLLRPGLKTSIERVSSVLCRNSLVQIISTARKALLEEESGQMGIIRFKACVKRFIPGSERYKEAWQALDNRFGQPDV
ncbi:Hypothetical predicted protein, partial [Paramuricea clavata]